MSDPQSCAVSNSVTEEESDDESDSDTSLTSRSKTDSVSSILYSSECATDDRLTSDLVNISISTNNNSNKKRQRIRKWGEGHDPSPYNTEVGSKPLTNCVPGQFKKRHKPFHSTAATRYVMQTRSSNVTHHRPFLPKQEEENFGVEDANNQTDPVYTDYSDTTSVQPDANNEISSSLASEEEEDEQRPMFPNMSGGSWFKARCFDRYWSHYGFVMDWYRQHVNAVAVISGQMMHPHSQPYRSSNCTTQPQTPCYSTQTTQYSYKGTSISSAAPSEARSALSKRRKRTRGKTRARNRRLAKARVKAAKEEEAQTAEATDSDSEVEMEITDEMMDFFATSFKHRKERDEKKDDSESKENEGMCDVVGNVKGPMEQPGARRKSEMDVLYGSGAAMIHGMETALQMNFDKVLDRHRPKPWPFMPLKIKFG